VREFGAVGERELDGCTCVEVDAGTGFAALVAHSLYSCAGRKPVLCERYSYASRLDIARSCCTCPM